MEEFFDLLLQKFPSDENFSFFLDVIMILLRRGPERWKFPLFVFLPALLQYLTILIIDLFSLPIWQRKQINYQYCKPNFCPFLAYYRIRYTCLFSSDELVHLAELVVYFCHSSNERLAAAAEELLPFVISHSQLCSVPLAVRGLPREHTHFVVVHVCA